ELQLSLKKLANSIYRQFGNSQSILKNYIISALVTAYRRKYLVEVLEFAESRIAKELNISEFIWEYSDMDSIFISKNLQDKENIWIKHVFETLIEKFIRYLYYKKVELDMELFEMTGRNNTENDDKEISIIEITQTDTFKPNN
ncbi:16888_t:CDS:2, partial [Dentiscutata heterogama]